MDRLAGQLIKQLREGPDGPSIVGLEDDDANQIFSVLSSETSRAVLSACYKDGRTQSELAAELDTSIQNIGYHVEKLEGAGLLEPAKTRYGENGQGIHVYEPAKKAILIAAGEPDTIDRLLAVAERLFAPITLLGLVTIASAIIARGPERVKLLADESVSATPESGPWIATGTFVFVAGIISILLADRWGKFERSDRKQRTGRSAVLFGKDTFITRQYLFSGLGLLLIAFLSLDAVLVGSHPQIEIGVSLALVLLLPISLILSLVNSARNNGILVSWIMTSAPIVGIWLYLGIAETMNNGISLAIIAVGPVLVLTGGIVLGSIGYLLGSWKRYHEIGRLIRPPE